MKVKNVFFPFADHNSSQICFMVSMNSVVAVRLIHGGERSSCFFPRATGQTLIKIDIKLSNFRFRFHFKSLVLTCYPPLTCVMIIFVELSSRVSKQEKKIIGKLQSFEFHEKLFSFFRKEMQRKT